jgi:histidinol phosphatase-like PHP family hydrolase
MNKIPRPDTFDRDSRKIGCPMSQNWQWHDLHIHTRPHSPDAHRRATLPAMLKKAAKNGVWIVGLANHYFLNTEFKIFQQLPHEISQKTPPGMTVLAGAELCVLDTTGAINLTESEARQLDFVLAGPHHFKQRWVEKPPKGSAADFVTHQHQMLLGAACNPLVNGLAHPWVINIQHAQRRWGFSTHDFLATWTEDHFAELGQVARNHDTALEIGMGIHLMAQHQGEPFWQMYVRGLQAARAAGAKFFFGSDAHHLFVIARLDWLWPTLERLDFTPDDIISPLVWQNRRK